VRQYSSDLLLRRLLADSQQAVQVQNAPRQRVRAPAPSGQSGPRGMLEDVVLRWLLPESGEGRELQLASGLSARKATLSAIPLKTIKFSTKSTKVHSQIFRSNYFTTRDL